MPIDKQKLRQYYNRIKDFENLNDEELLLYLGYYLQTEKEQDFFYHNNINEYLSYIPLSKFENIDMLISNLREKERLLPHSKETSILNYYESDRIKSNLPSIKNRIEKIYDGGKILDFNEDVKSIFLDAETEIFLIDGYAGEDIIRSYINKVPDQIKIMILTNKLSDDFRNDARKFKKKSSNFKVKLNEKCHDRLFFVDKRCFVMGQSLDKAASSQPTYLVEIENSGPFRNVYQKLYDEGDNLNLGS